jgi:hypothetical protein
MIYMHLAFGQKFFVVAVRPPVAQVPAHRDRDHLAKENLGTDVTGRRRIRPTLPGLRSVNATVPRDPVHPAAGRGWDCPSTGMVAGSGMTTLQVEALKVESGAARAFQDEQNQAFAHRRLVNP